MSSPRRLEQRARAVRSMARVRWFGVVFALFQVLTFTVPYPPGYKEAALVLTGLLGVGNLLMWVVSRSGDAARVARLAPLSLLLDLFVLMGFIFIYTFDPDTSIWAIIYVAPLEGAMLYQKRGALLTMAAASVFYAVREVVGSSLFDYEFLAVSVTFRMGIGFMIAAVAGAATEHLVEERDRVATSEERLEAILRNSRDAVIVIKADGVVSYASSATKRLLGYSPRELRGRVVWDLLEPDERPGAQRTLDWMLAGSGRAASTVVRARHRDGTLVWIEITATDQVQDPAIGGVLLNVHDVTQRKVAEDELAATNQRLTTVLANLPGMAYRCKNDEHWTMLFISEGVRALTGHEPEALMSGEIRYSDLVHPADLDRIWAEVQAAVDRQEPFEIEYRIRTASGREKWVWEQGRGVTPEADILEGLVIDATERKHLETALAESQKMEAVGRLAGGIAHDFNNILSVVVNFADLLAESHPNEDALRQDLIEIRNAGLRGANLVRQLLTFSRRDSGALEPVVVTDVVSEMANLLRKAAGETVSLEIDTTTSSAVLIDRTKLEQVLLNLVVNARDATGSGSIMLSTADRVVVDGFSSTTGRVEPGEYVVLSVVDTGEGMAPEVVEHIFEPFFTTKLLGRGTGLGLSTVYGVVQTCGGHIDVESEPGGGTSFSIYLPSTSDQASEPAQPADVNGGVVRGKTILVVEDEDAVRSAVQRILTRRGHEVYTAVDGWDALARLKEKPVNLLIADVAMPGLSGSALVEHLREQNVTMPVIFMSGYDDGTLAKHGLDHPDQVLLKKPFLAEALVQAVRDALEGTHS